LFLDDVDALPAEAQALLLRLVEQGEAVPVGGDRPVKVDARVLAASQHDLEKLAAQRRFRADLLARLSGLTIVVPPLRERREDLGIIVRGLLQRKLADSLGDVSFTCEAARALLMHGWPGNVRELERALEAALATAGQDRIGLRHLPAPLRDPVPASHPATNVTPGPTEPAPTVKVQHFLDELSRRKVVRVVIAYSVAVFGALQGADVIVTRLSLPPQWMTWIVAGCLAGLPVAAILAWIFDWTRHGIVRTQPLSPRQSDLLARGRHLRKRNLALAGCALGLIAAVGVMWWRNRARPSSPNPPTIPADKTP
ncbi:MAG TPA: sigma 54-interacting transcriptional regulator, partial [Myxococcales bacterium]|nr:sigma 54-interacting transcriptional regulator [Myxococcales bacterium]